jgi:hypothetical protein
MHLNGGCEDLAAQRCVPLAFWQRLQIEFDRFANIGERILNSCSLRLAALEFRTLDNREKRSTISVSGRRWVRISDDIKEHPQCPFGPPRADRCRATASASARIRRGRRPRKASQRTETFQYYMVREVYR